MNKKGFTFIELLIVVIVIGVLAAISIPQFAKSLEKARGTDAREGLIYIYRAEIDYSGLRGGVFYKFNKRTWRRCCLNPKILEFYYRYAYYHYFYCNCYS